MCGSSGMCSICRAIIIEFPPPHKADAGGGLSKKGPPTASGIRKNFRVLLTQGDMSRLGRNYLQVGYYTDTYFPEHNVRFIAVNDGVDSDQGEQPFDCSFTYECSVAL